MKQKLLFAIAALGAVTVSSCSNEDDFENLASGNALASREITFGDPFVSKTSTRAVIDNSNIKEQTLRVWAEMANTGTQSWINVFNGTELSNVGGVWKPATPAYWYEYKDYRFTAVHPASAPFSYADGKIALTDVPAVHPVATATDYMVSDQFTTTTNSQEREPINLTMTHMMSKLTFLVKRTGDYDVRVNSSKVWLPKSDITASYQAEGGDINKTDASSWTYVSTFDNTATDPSSDYSAYTCYADDILLSDDAVAGASYLVAPHASLSMFIDLDFDILDSEGKILRNKKISKMVVKRDNMQMLPNSAYGITVNIKANSYADVIEFGELSINDWDDFSNTTHVEQQRVKLSANGVVKFTVDGKIYTFDGTGEEFSVNYKPKSFMVGYYENGQKQNDENLTTIDLQSINLSEVKDWSNMFSHCKSITSISNLTKWDNGQITRIDSLFAYSPEITKIDDLSNLDLSKVTSLNRMFYGCSKLKSIGDISNWDTSNATDLGLIFAHCYELENIGDISNWNVSKATSLLATFYKCQSLTGVWDLRNWDVSNVTDMGSMFDHCNGIEEINLHGWNTSKVIDLAFMFDMRNSGDEQKYEAWSMMRKLDLGGWDTSNVINFDYMFDTLDSLEELILDGWKISEAAVNTPSQYDNPSGITGMFKGANPNMKIYARGCDDFTIQALRSVMPEGATLITE